MIVTRRCWAAASLAAVLAVAACSSTTSGQPAARRAPQRASSSADPATPSSAASPAPSSTQGTGANRPFRCTAQFITTLQGYPVAARVRHYPVPDLTPEPFDLSGQTGLDRLRQGELDIVYTARSTKLPQGPSRAMYRCFVRHAPEHGWQPDTHMNALGKKDKKASDPLSFWFIDSGSKYKGGNELSVTFFTSKQAFGMGNQLEIGIRPNGYLPVLHPPK
jgi:hypothetical protein